MRIENWKVILQWGEATMFPYDCIDPGNMEYVLEGQSRHACYRMYKHDTPNIPGVNAYIKYEWDKTMKVQLVS